ncbi:MAG: HAD family hydrolase [Caldiserica bacterium]|nr:HAD family hydrolase [Caldisericota bacterium]
MRRYDAVLFDVDDTLLDFRASEAAACRAVFDLYPVTGLSPDVVLAAFQHASDITWDLYVQKRITRAEVSDQTFESLARLLPMSDHVDTHAAALAFDAAFAEHSVAEPAASCVLASLHGWYVTGIISNHEHPAVQRRRLAASGLARSLDVVVISGDIGIEKPDPRIFNYTLQLLGMAAEQCLFVGDSIISDDAGAREAGMDFCWYRRHHTTPSAPTTTLNIIQSLSELLVLLDAPDVLER